MSFSSKKTRLVARTLSVALVWCGMQASVAQAAFVPTHALVAGSPQAVVDSRSALAHTLAREDVRAQLLAYGVKPEVVEARIAALTDAEARQLADQMAELPAGGSGLGVVVLVLLVLVLTDVLGVTDVFPAIRPSI